MSFANVTVVAGPTGSYIGTGGTPVTWVGFNFVTGPQPISPLWTYTFGASTYTFDLGTINAVVRNAHDSLFISGIGTVSISGGTYSPTPARWTFTIDDSSGGNSGSFIFGFSDSNTAVAPDGGTTAMLLGAALAGLGLLRKKLTA